MIDCAETLRSPTAAYSALKLFGQSGQSVTAENSLQREPTLAHGIAEPILSGLDRLLSALMGEPLPDLGAGARGADEPEPVLGRSGGLGLGGENLDGVTVGQLALQRDQTAVDSGTDASVPDLGMHGVGEVHRGTALRKADHVTLRSEDENLLRTEFEAQGLQELAGLLVLPLPVQQLAEPQHLVVALGRRAALGLLVLPVRGNAELRRTVHVTGTDLQLDRLAMGADDGGVQRLVEVELRHRDEVLEPPGDRLPVGMDDTESGIAVTYGLHDDPDSHEIPDVSEIPAPHDHLLIDGVVVLGSPGHHRWDVGCGELTAYGC
jgi:hypothetical protein